MKLTKEVVLSALSNITLPNEGKDIVESGAIKNIQIFGTDVELDVEIKIPTLQYKKRVEVDCIKAIHDYAFEKSKVKVNLIVNTPPKQTQIKGSPIPGIKNIIAINRVRYSPLAQQYAQPEDIFEEIKAVIATGDYTLGKKYHSREERNCY